MFWTKALPSAQINEEQIRRSFDVVEAPDSAVFLTSVMHILSAGLGYKVSIEQNTCVLGDGRPIPMMSYSLVEYLLGLDLSSFDLLELGGGRSTSFWANRTRSVFTFETDAVWLKVLQSRSLMNMETRLTTAQTLAQDMLALGRSFDVIVIDAAANRYQLARNALTLLRPGGFIILDNSDWYPNAAGLLRNADLIQVDFHDFRAQHHFRCTTSLFMHREFRAKPRSTRMPLPPVGGKDVAGSNDWDRPEG